MDRRFLKPGWLVGHLLVVLAVLVCLRLGWWQWDRTHDADGDFQNLGYAVLWPAFGAGFIYMWARFLQLERTRDVADDQDLDDDLRDLLATDTQPTANVNPAESVAAQQDSPADDSDGVVKSTAADAPANIAGLAEPTPDDQDVFVGTVNVTDEEDPELAAYNRALAAIAEEDRRRGN